ncbi:MFS transporter, partial [Evtepia gabavorous]
EVLPLVPLLIGVLMLLYGISGAYQPSVQASLPLLVPEEGLVQANALVNMVSTLAGLLGPVVGGVLFGAFGVYPIVLVSALCFFASAVMECFLRIPHNGRPRTDSPLRTVKGDLAESWRFMGREKPNFLRVTLLLALFNLVLSAAIIVGIPIMVVQLLHGSDTQLGLTQGALGLGGLMGGLLASGLGARLRLHHSPLLLLLASGGVVLMGVALLPLVSPIVGYGLITVLSFLVMGVSTLFTVTILAAMQGQTPPDLLGKVMATVLATANCAQPLGQAVYGLLFEGLADHAWAVMLGAGLLAACLALRARPVFWALEKETDRSAGDATVR